MIHGLDTGFLVAAEVREHAEHAGARVTLAQVLSAGDVIAIAPQVLAEFIHGMTPPARVSEPCSASAGRSACYRLSQGSGRSLPSYVPWRSLY